MLASDPQLMPQLGEGDACAVVEPVAPAEQASSLVGSTAATAAAARSAPSTCRKIVHAASVFCTREHLPEFDDASLCVCRG